MGFKNIAMYITMKQGMILSKMEEGMRQMKQQINIDKEGRSAYHCICYKGNYECLIVMLNIERIFQKKVLFDRLVRAKNEYQFKNMDIKQGELSSQVFHDAETVRRFDSFNIKVMSIFQQYSKDIQDTYRQILS